MAIDVRRRNKRSHRYDGIWLQAVGDVHGCARLLRNPHEFALVDAKRASEECQIVVYLDRGPDSRDVNDWFRGRIRMRSPEGQP